MSAHQNPQGTVWVIVRCPSCGASDHEIDFEPEDIASGATVSIPCDECPKRIAVFIIVDVQAEDHR